MTSPTRPHRIRWNPDLSGSGACTTCGAIVRTNDTGGPRGGACLEWSFDQVQWAKDRPPCEPASPADPPQGHVPPGKHPTVEVGLAVQGWTHAGCRAFHRQRGTAVACAERMQARQQRHLDRVARLIRKWEHRLAGQEASPDYVLLAYARSEWALGHWQTAHRDLNTLAARLKNTRPQRNLPTLEPMQDRRGHG